MPHEKKRIKETFMKNVLKILFLFLLLAGTQIPASEAALPTFDAVNAALNEIRNALMESQFAQDIALAIERLNELKAQTLEMLRFHSGPDEILDSLIEDPLKSLTRLGRGSLRDAFMDSGLITPQLQILEEGGEPSDIRASLEAITGKIPQGNARTYIPFEEMQVVDAFDLANQIRKGGQDTRDAADLIAEQAKSASPKGAARLQAQGVSQLMVLEQQNQEAMAKIIELEATQVEQVSREEKQAERDRLKFMEDTNEYLDAVLTST